MSSKTKYFVEVSTDNFKSYRLYQAEDRKSSIDLALHLCIECKYKIYSTRNNTYKPDDIFAGGSVSYSGSNLGYIALTRFRYCKGSHNEDSNFVREWMTIQPSLERIGG